MVLTIYPDVTPKGVTFSTQTPNWETGEEPVGAEEMEVDTTTVESRLPLLYAALLNRKSDTTREVKKLLAKVRDDHKHLPGGIVFRVHGDKGSEFLTTEMEKYLALAQK